VGAVLQAYRFALDPSVEQQRALRSHCGGQRYAYNWGLARVRANLGQRNAERTYGLGDGELTPPLNWSAYSLRKEWNQLKHVAAPWWSENSKEVYSSGFAHLAAALSNWNASAAGRRRGAQMRFPRFKGKRAAQSCRFTTGSRWLVDRDRRHVQLPTLGVIRTHESTRKLARHVERGNARIRSATVSFRGGRWFVSFSVEITRTDVTPAQPGSVVGVDLGVKSLAVLSTGEIIPNPKHLDAAQGELRRLHRQSARRRGPHRRDGEPSQRWRKTRVRLVKLHARVANARRDGLNKLSTRLVRAFEVIVLEDLNVSGMMRNRRLARHIAGVGMAELRRQIEYKAAWSGAYVHTANRWYASSKTCSGCGAVKAKLLLSERSYQCDECALVLDRDLNAARNLAALVSSRSWWVTENEPDGNPRKTRAKRAGVPPREGPGQLARVNAAIAR
jgi:putative transposase